MDKLTGLHDDGGFDEAHAKAYDELANQFLLPAFYVAPVCDSFPTGTVFMDKTTHKDCDNGTYEVTYRFTAEPPADAPVVVVVKGE